MKTLRQYILFPIVVASMLLVFTASNAYAVEISLDVAPNVLNISSKSVVVTVHTDIAYSMVVGSSVFLNDVAIDHWKADNRGNFVAKFNSDEVKALDGLIIGDYNTLVLTGYDIDGEPLIGTQDILVVDIKPKGKN